jgi:large subunit ribosomal protein L4
METNLFLDNFIRKKTSIGLIHKVYLVQLKNSRNYLASTKTKSEVRGGGKKPWRQKGTGQARAGSTRSPLWVGGGVSFGPKPRIVSKKINKKEKQLAIFSALNLKKNNLKFFNDSFELNSYKTKDILTLLKNLKINTTSKILIILPKSTKKVWLATRNLKNIEVTTLACLNLKTLLHSETILLSKESLELINLLYEKIYA